MSDEDQSTQTPPRVGSNADLARRMDRMEGRQDTIETEVRTLAATVSRVELNQTHGTELAKLRFDALDTGVKQGFAELTAFQSRIEGIIEGTVTLPAWKMVTDRYESFAAQSILDRKELFARIEAIEDDHLKRDARNASIIGVVAGTRGFLLLIAAIASPLIATIALILTSH